MKTNEKKLICETEEFTRTQMQKQRIIQNLKDRGGRMTRQNMYKVVCGGDCGQTEVYSVEFDDGTAVQLPAESWYQVVRIGLKECGYLKNRELRCVSVSTGGPSGFRGRESEIG